MSFAAAIVILLVAGTLAATSPYGVFAQIEDAEDQDEPGEDILETEDDSESAEEEGGERKKLNIHHHLEPKTAHSVPQAVTHTSYWSLTTDKCW